jgi:myo-inositol-1(or 4)-monophosphatase
MMSSVADTFKKNVSRCLSANLHISINIFFACLAEIEKIAFKHFGRAYGRLKADKSLVTEADEAIEELFKRFLKKTDPKGYLLGEESVAGKGLRYVVEAFDADSTWIIDPIDGTAGFAAGLPTWGISIAHFVRGRPDFGCLCLPTTGERFWRSGRESWHSFSGKTRRILMKPGPVSPRRLICLANEIARGFLVKTPFVIQCLSSAVYPLANLSLGRYLAYVGKVQLWDMAGAWAMLEPLGVHFFRLDDPREKVSRLSEDYFDISRSQEGKIGMRWIAVACHRSIIRDFSKRFEMKS